MIKKLYILTLLIVFSFSTYSFADKNMMSVGTEGKSNEVTRIIKIKIIKFLNHWSDPRGFAENPQVAKDERVLNSY